MLTRVVGRREGIYLSLLAAAAGGGDGCLGRGPGSTCGGDRRLVVAGTRGNRRKRTCKPEDMEQRSVHITPEACSNSSSDVSFIKREEISMTSIANVVRC